MMYGHTITKMTVAFNLFLFDMIANESLAMGEPY